MQNQFLMEHVTKSKLKHRLFEWYKELLFYGKYVVIVTLIGFILYRVVVVNSSGHTSCTSMVASGEWVEFSWTTPTCLMEEYTSSADLMKTCVSAGVRVLMIGNKHMRELFSGLIHSLQGHSHSFSVGGQVLEQLLDSDSKINVSYLEESAVLMETFKAYQRVLEDKDWLKKKIIIFQNGCPSALIEEKDVQQFKKNMTRLLQVQTLFLRKSKKSKVVWLPQSSEDVGAERTKCNQIAEEIYSGNQVIYLKPLEDVEGQSSGVLEKHKAILQQAKLNLVLNTFCNDLALQSKGTCCVSKLRSTFTNVLVGFLLLIVAFYFGMQMIIVTNTVKGILPLLGVQLPKDQKGLGQYAEHAAIVLPSKLGVIALTLGYIIIIECTQLFVAGRYRLNEQYIQITLSLVAVLGSIFTISYTDEKDTAMSREIVSEGKGMSISILVLVELLLFDQMNTMAVYVVLRFCWSLFLFLFGYEHFVHFVSSGKITTKRVSQVLLGLGLLPILFYIGGVSSFFPIKLFVWLLIWCVLIAALVFVYISSKATHNNSSSNKVCFQHRLAAGAVTLILAILFSLLNYLYSEVKGSSLQWEADIFSDSICLIMGALLGMTVSTSREMKHLSTALKGIKKSTVFLFSITVATFSIVVYVAGVAASGNAVTFAIWHPYVVSLVLCGLVMLRNSTAFLRSVKCYAFEVIGSISYEVFLLYKFVLFHGQQKTMLYIFPEQPLLNVILMLLNVYFIARAVNGIFTPASQTDNSVNVRQQ